MLALRSLKTEYGGWKMKISIVGKKGSSRKEEEKKIKKTGLRLEELYKKILLEISSVFEPKQESFEYLVYSDLLVDRLRVSTLYKRKMFKNSLLDFCLSSFSKEDSVCSISMGEKKEERSVLRLCFHFPEMFWPCEKEVKQIIVSFEKELQHFGITEVGIDCEFFILISGIFV